MSIHTVIARHVLAPAFDGIRGTATMRRLAHLEKSQWWSRTQIEEQQAVHLRKLISHAYAHVPYYRQVLDERGLQPGDIHTTEDLQQLPALTKADVRANFARLQSTDVPREQLRAGWSGGTTGERLAFCSTRQERLTYAYARWALTLGWTGVQLGEPHVSIRQQLGGARPGILGRLSLRLQQLTRVDTMDVREENLASLVCLFQRIRPRTVFSYPSALALVASYARSHELAFPHIPSVCIGGEMMHERQRAVLEDVFGSVPFIRYGSNELHEVSGQCEVHDGLHILAEDFVIEVVDDAGFPVPDGERGQLLITSLHNYGMPFIRYAPGDIGTLRVDACPCGRGLPLMDARIGRTRDYLVSPAGTRVAAMDVDVAPLLPPGVVQYQLVQNGPDHFRLRAVPESDTADSTWLPTRQAASSVLSAQMGARVSVEVQLVDHIDMNLSGKRLSFISHLNSEPGDRSHD
jgi:phenylacetate-CoA ligase